MCYTEHSSFKQPCMYVHTLFPLKVHQADQKQGFAMNAYKQVRQCILQ